MDEITIKYMEKGCPCGAKGPVLSNFFRFMGDNHFYCYSCRLPLQEKFIDLLGIEEYSDACERMKKYLKVE